MYINERAVSIMVVNNIMPDLVRHNIANSEVFYKNPNNIRVIIFIDIHT